MVQRSQGTRHDEDARDQRHAPVLLARTTRRPDGPMGYGPRAPSGDRDPESHIFRGED
ncbi:hypothetical protein MMF93_06500 [Streptomyces tubbatahanensis]|uniref:Uncharacterized protein n=1 Tax=Streptomyces tubbatahanensis TaxID=2923272 RepID=A0ABY3XPR3_9ACTN|nr:hypothetical protein [Streptomyces tubbatahanensis]UNS96188.1 hypothetical protein MMF93_06500 [Streptomyces tubbatahanensis]